MINDVGGWPHGTMVELHHQTVTTGPLFKYRVCNLFYEMAIVGSVDQNHNQIELDRLNGKDCGIGCNLMGLGD